MPLHFPSTPAGRQPVKADLHAAAHAAAPAGASSLDPRSQAAQAAAQNAETCRQPHADADPAGGTAVPRGLHTQLLVHACAPALQPQRCVHEKRGGAGTSSQQLLPLQLVCRHLHTDADPAGGTTAAANGGLVHALNTFSAEAAAAPVRACTSFAAASGPYAVKGDSKHGPDACTTPVHACTNQAASAQPSLRDVISEQAQEAAATLSVRRKQLLRSLCQDTQVVSKRMKEQQPPLCLPVHSEQPPHSHQQEAVTVSRCRQPLCRLTAAAQLTLSRQPPCRSDFRCTPQL